MSDRLSDSRSCTSRGGEERARAPFAVVINKRETRSQWSQDSNDSRNQLENPSENPFKPKHKRRSLCCRICCGCTIFWFLLIIALGAYVLVLLPFAAPTIKTSHVINKPLQLSDKGDTAFFYLDMTIISNITNPNKIAFTLTTAHFDVNYGGQKLLEVDVPETKFPAKETTVVAVAVEKKFSMRSDLKSALLDISRRCSKGERTFPLKVAPILKATIWLLPFSVAIPKSLIPEMTINVDCGEIGKKVSRMAANVNKNAAIPASNDDVIDAFDILDECKKVRDESAEKRAAKRNALFENRFFANVVLQKLGVTELEYKAKLTQLKSESPEQSDRTWSAWLDAHKASIEANGMTVQDFKNLDFKYGSEL